ncbi:uncharacterized [Tachysurus ichikawai]
MKRNKDIRTYFFMQKVRQSQTIQVGREPAGEERTIECRKNCQMESSKSRVKVMEKLSVGQNETRVSSL